VTAKSVALVTGGAIRVGAAISSRLARSGFHVAVNYNDSDAAAQELIDQLRGDGLEAMAIQADIADADQAERLVRQTVSELGRLDVLVNNAAIFERREYLELDLEMWNQTLSVNLMGAVFTSQAAARLMWEAGQGRIINICGTAGVGPPGAYAPYCVSKAGLDMLTRAMAQALAPRVQVNGVAPGTVMFPEGTPEEERAKVIRRIPAGHVGSPDDVAAAVEFLAGAPDYLTGTIVTVDGGASLMGS
jgi:NAD(P)-dependent dehydrogenase (short-subunit alcohol dehydrogenase family)